MDLFVALIDNLPTIIIEIVKAVPQIIEGIVSAFGNPLYKIVDVGKNLVKGLWEGIKSLASWIWDKVSGWASDLWNGILDFFGIHSPSKKFAWIGEMMVEGLAGSIEDNGDEAIRAAEDLSSGIDDVMQDVSKSMTEGVPAKFNIKGSVSGVKDPIIGGNGLQLQLNISTFNNYSVEDIEQLTNEIMATAGSFIRRQREVFA